MVFFGGPACLFLFALHHASLIKELLTMVESPKDTTNYGGVGWTHTLIDFLMLLVSKFSFLATSERHFTSFWKTTSSFGFIFELLYSCLHLDVGCGFCSIRKMCMKIIHESRFIKRRCRLKSILQLCHLFAWK